MRSVATQVTLSLMDNVEGVARGRRLLAHCLQHLHVSVSGTSLMLMTVTLWSTDLMLTIP